MKRFGWAATAVAAMMTCAWASGAIAQTLDYAGTIVDAEIVSSPLGAASLGLDGVEFHYFSQGYLVVPPFGHYDSFFDSTFYSDGTFSVFNYGVPDLGSTVSFNGDNLKIFLPQAGSVHADFTGESSISFDLRVESVLPVPLPAAIPLFGTALLTLGVLSYRRRAYR